MLLVLLLSSSSLGCCTVGCAFIFVGDWHVFSQAGSSLATSDEHLCTGGGICFFVLGTLFVGFVCFSLEVHSFHGVDSFCLFCMCSLFYCLSQCRVGGS